ncbi:MAG: zinc-finger domain-containing protein [Burkholderiales bacterium]|nr:zinc-finger domain-containing protein [Burkholderiales bacterium]
MAKDTKGSELMVEISAAELPLHCPTRSQVMWNAHPRVYLPIEETGTALCPYCGTRYVLKSAPAGAGH